MSKRMAKVNNPQSPVLIDNIAGSMISITRDNEKTFLMHPGETAQVTWSEFVRLKTIPHFGGCIKLNDSVIIADGQVKIGHVSVNLSEEEMVSMLVQDIPTLKEFVMELSKGEKTIFKAFLKTRLKLGIESEKCEEILLFMGVKPKKNAESTNKKESSEGSKKVIVTENEEALSAHVSRAKDVE